MFIGFTPILDPADIEEITVPLSGLRFELDPEIMDPPPYVNGIQDIFETIRYRRPEPPAPPARPAAVPTTTVSRPDTVALSYECLGCGDLGLSGDLSGLRPPKRGGWTSLVKHGIEIARRSHFGGLRFNPFSATRPMLPTCVGSPVVSVMVAPLAVHVVIGVFMRCQSRDAEPRLKHSLSCSTCKIAWESLAPICEHEHALVEERFRAQHPGHDVTILVEVDHGQGLCLRRHTFLT